MGELVVGLEYGEAYQGVYRIKKLSWAEGRELFRRLTATKDTVAYIEDVMITSVSGPVALERGKLHSLPMQLVRRLQDAALEENETSKAETDFLSNSHSAEAPSSRPTATQSSKRLPSIIP